jgi:hypothetical protein
MSYTNINEGKKLVDLNHPNAIPTAEIEKDLIAKFPNLLFPYMKQDHVAGVRSNVHAWCEKHDAFTRMSVAGARHAGTKYGCSLCANEHKGGPMPEGVSKRYNFAGYVGRVGVQSGIFRAVKAEFPDAIWEHRMDNGKEIDIYVPSIYAGIEYNGNYYHSNAIQKNNNYHLEKSFGGLKEGKYIFHVMTEEAVAPYTNLVHLLKILRDGEDTKPQERSLYISKCKSKQISTALATEFHNAYNFRQTNISYKRAEIHVGIFHKSELVGVVSSSCQNRCLGVWQTSVKYPQVGIMQAIGRSALTAKAASALVAADLSNPVEVMLVVAEITGCTALRGKFEKEFVNPSPHSLNSRYELDADLPQELATATVWDCGSMSYYFKLE